MQSIFSKLKVGSLVEIESMNTQNKKINLKTIVEEVISESELKLFLPIHKGVNYPFRINESFTLVTIVRYPNSEKYDIFSCRAKVISKDKEGAISTITILKTSEHQKVQRRNYFRLPLIKSMTVVFNETNYELLSKDLSGNGIRGYLNKKIPAGSEASLMFETENKVNINVNIKVIECSPDTKDDYRYDFRATFVNLKSSQLSEIMRYIFFKQSESIKKQFNFHDHASILDSDQSYSDFFSMSNVEKLIRIAPIALWAVVLIQYAYLMMAFRNLNKGINFFFNQVHPTFKPEFLVTANAIAYIVIILASAMLAIDYIYNKTKPMKLSISLILQIILSIVTIIFYQVYL